MTKGAHRVRFVHFGALFEGQIRPACRPAKTTMAMTGNIKKVTCHHCNMVLDDFFKDMEKRKERGELPDDFTGKGVRKREHRATVGEGVSSRTVFTNRSMRRAKIAANRTRNVRVDREREDEA